VCSSDLLLAAMQVVAVRKIVNGDRDLPVGRLCESARRETRKKPAPDQRLGKEHLQRVP